MFHTLALFLLVLAPSLAYARPTCRDLTTDQVIRMTVSVNGDDRELLLVKPLPTKKRVPVVIYFHGTNVPVETVRPEGAPYGLFHESSFIRELSSAGFLVVAPTARAINPYVIYPSVLAWQANVPPYSTFFEQSRDFALAQQLLDTVETLTNQNVDLKNIFLAGFSSGGYMASRLVQFEELAQKVRGILVHSASYGECLANQCRIPQDLPDWHPSTLLVANEDDGTVPFSTVENYRRVLDKNKVPVHALFSESGDHAWREEHPEEIIRWLRSSLHRP